MEYVVLGSHSLNTLSMELGYGSANVCDQHTPVTVIDALWYYCSNISFGNPLLIFFLFCKLLLKLCYKA